MIYLLSNFGNPFEILMKYEEDGAGGGTSGGGIKKLKKEKKVKKKKKKSNFADVSAKLREMEDNK